MDKQKIIDLIKAEYWRPMSKVTNVEFETMKLYNELIEGLLERIKEMK